MALDLKETMPLEFYCYRDLVIAAVIDLKLCSTCLIDVIRD